MILQIHDPVDWAAANDWMQDPESDIAVVAVIEEHYGVTFE